MVKYPHALIDICLIISLSATLALSLKNAENLKVVNNKLADQVKTLALNTKALRYQAKKDKILIKRIATLAAINNRMAIQALIKIQGMNKRSHL